MVDDRYDDGYAAGKAKGIAEVLRVLDAGHVDGCGCEPCIVIRTVQEDATCKGHDKRRVIVEFVDPRLAGASISGEIMPEPSPSE